MSVDFDLVVDRTSEVPVGTQLAWKLRTLIATGQLGAGARLPGIRELAELAKVNINTVRAVLGRLEEQGLLVTEQGRGSFVADTAQTHASLAATADAVISQALADGIDPRELAAALYVTSHGPREAAATDARSERRKLRAQIERLELELAEIEPLGRLATAPADPQPRLLSTAELREVRDHLAARIARLDQQRRQWRAESERAEAEEAATARPRTRHWGAGVWTGRAGAQVSWTTA